MFKKLYGVEYKTDVDMSSYDIFYDKKEADEYAEELGKKAMFMFEAKFDMHYVFAELDGGLNYEDNVHLINYGTYNVIKCYTCNADEDKENFVQVLDENIGFEADKDIGGDWTEEYREGYVDGLKRAREIAKDTLFIED